MSPAYTSIRSQETRLHQLVQFMGLPDDAVRFVGSAIWNQVLTDGMDSRDRRPLVIELGPGLDCPLLQAWLDNPPCDAGRRDIFFFGAGSTGSRPNREPGPPPETLKSNRVNIPARSEIRFCDDPIWGALQGLSANWPISPEFSQKISFELLASCEPLITIRDQPWFVRSTSDTRTVFLWAPAHLPDILESVKPADAEQDERLLGLLPLLVFLRHAFGKRTWQAPTCLANFTIDDPPLCGRYGFFEPARHLASLADTLHFTTVAFIPWYWNHSTRAAVEFFRDHNSQLSLCVHGCDHTGGEFASGDRVTLTAKCRLALDRSERLKERTGLSCEPVMVFPQNLFSKAAVAALRATSFLGAVSINVFAVDAQQGDIRIADLMEPAYTSIEDFPIFRRRYPWDPVLCALDLFLGRPLLIAEHQKDFRHGYGECRRFLEAINSFRCRLSWVSLDRIVRRACLQREIDSGRFEVRFYSNHFVFENPSAQRLSYRLVRRCSRSEMIRAVVVNGSPVAHAFKDGQIIVELEIHPRTSVTIQLVENGLGANALFKGSLSYSVRVWARRILCELRDNNIWIWQFAQWLKRVRHRGGNSA